MSVRVILDSTCHTLCRVRILHHLVSNHPLICEYSCLLAIITYLNNTLIYLYIDLSLYDKKH